MANKIYPYIKNKRSNLNMNQFNQSVDRSKNLISQPEISISNIDKSKKSNNNITMTDLSCIGVNSKSDLKLNKNTTSELRIINHLNYSHTDENIIEESND